MDDTSTKIIRRLYTASTVRELDRITIEEHHIPGIELMHRAGQSVWDTLIKHWSETRRILVVCGAGNNAGDGYVIARLACNFKMNVTVVALTLVDKLKNDALTAANEYINSGYQVINSIDDVNFSEIDVIVDAILGTGLDRDVDGNFFKAINRINASTVPVISVDIPSGLNADTGTIMGAAVKAACTVSFIGQKQGLYTAEAAEYCGDRVFTTLDIPEEAYLKVPVSAELIDIGLYKNLFTERRRTGHKGHYGHVMVIGGDYGFAGAARMCGEASARTGAGLVSIATRPEHAYTLSAGCPELMTASVSSPGDLGPLLEKVAVTAIGPGLGQSSWSMSLLSRMLDSGIPMVVDADALNLLATDPVSRDNWVLTPHPGEAARLLGTTVAEVQSDRIFAAKALQKQYGGVIVLKGPGTIIVTQQAVKICNEGNPGMATGGMGDILTGIIAGLMAQGHPADVAAAVGVCLHARAGDMSARQSGERGMLATDLLPFLRSLVNPDK